MFFGEDSCNLALPVSCASLFITPNRGYKRQQNWLIKLIMQSYKWNIDKNISQ